MAVVYISQLTGFLSTSNRSRGQNLRKLNYQPQQKSLFRCVLICLQMFLSFFRNAFKETLCGRPRINSVYIPSKTDIQIPNNGANIQNGLDRNGRQRLHLQASAISTASEVKVSSETVVLLNGQDNDFDRNKTMDGLSLTVTTLTNNGVSEQVER